MNPWLALIASPKPVATVAHVEGNRIQPAAALVVAHDRVQLVPIVAVEFRDE